MDEVTQKVVDGTAWKEFCDLLAAAAAAGDAVLADGNPEDPLDRTEGFRPAQLTHVITPRRG
jgi:hypothetical protein